MQVIKQLWYKPRVLRNDTTIVSAESLGAQCIFNGFLIELALVDYKPFVIKHIVLLPV